MGGILYKVFLWCLMAGFFLSKPVYAQVVLNELLYDPAGTDAGKEWVELFSSQSVSLEGIQLEFGNGSAPGQWTVLWTGTASDRIEAGGFFVVGESETIPTDADVALSLQNGPDGVRLVGAAGELDRVGWGSLKDVEYYEGTPASRSGSGKSLARTRDGQDTQDNQVDFEPATPSPGQPNAPEVDVALTLSVVGRALPIPASSNSFSVLLHLVNLGQDVLDPTSIRLWAAGREIAGPDSPLGPKASWQKTVSVAVDGGSIVSATARVSVLGDVIEANDQAELSLARLPGPLRFRRIHPRPEASQPEWVELEILEELEILSSWAILDASGAKFVFGAENGPFRNGDLLEVSSLSGQGQSGEGDPGDGQPGEGGNGPSGDGRTMASGTGWPSLNDTAKSDGAADTLFVVDPEGRVRDWAAFGELERGETWVRVEGAAVPAGIDEWAVSSADRDHSDAGTLALPSAQTWDEERPYVSLQEDSGGTWLPVPSQGSYSLQVLDLTGRSVWRSTGNRTDGRLGSARWDGRGLNGELCPEGVYVLQTLLRDGDGRWTRRDQSLVLGR